MAKKVKDIAKELVAQGFDVKVYVRKDGGVLIKEINGQKFTGASGNQAAREMVGEVLSEKRKVQLEEATKKRTTFSEQFGRSVYNRFKKVQTKWRKASLPKSAGKISIKKFRKIASEQGVEEALKMLSEKEKYASGIAYSKNVEALALAVEDYADKIGDSQLDELARDIRANDGKIREDAIKPAYDELYRFNTEPLTDELVTDVVSNVRIILGI